jgi:hypothetical protein
MPQSMQESATPTPTEVGLWVNLPSLGAMLKFEFEGPLPAWFPEVIESLDRLSRLPKNWDSYGADPIRHSCIFAAIQLLLWIVREGTPRPSVVPTNHQTVLLEWHTRGADLEVEVEGLGSFDVSFEDPAQKTEWEGKVTYDLGRLAGYIARLSNG